MKRRIKLFLQRLGLYDRLRFSLAMNFYKRITHHPEIILHKKELAFYRSFLPPCSLIFDIGAHHGFKAAVFLEMSKEVVACDPDPSNIKLLKNKFRKDVSLIHIREEALGPKQGTASFLIHHPGSAFNTLNPYWKELLEDDKVDRWNEKIEFEKESITVPVTTLDALIKQYGLPDFIKIDAEGYEKQILEGLTQKVPYMSFECLLPEFIEPLKDCLNYLKTLSPAATFNIAVDEKLLFPSFLNIVEIESWATTTSISHFEVIAAL